MFDPKAFKQAVNNFSKVAGQIMIPHLSAAGRLMRQLNERPDFQLLVISLKAREQKNPYRYFLYHVMLRYIKARHKDRKYWFKLLLGCIGARQHLKVYFMLRKKGVGEYG